MRANLKSGRVSWTKRYPQEGGHSKITPKVAKPGKKEEVEGSEVGDLRAPDMKILRERQNEDIIVQRLIIGGEVLKRKNGI